jgi:hypothetical protein
VLEKDSKDVPISTCVLRPGGACPIKVVALRRDGFNGEIQLSVEGLPPGVTCAATSIAPSSNSVIVYLQASEEAQASYGQVRVSGSAILNGAVVTHVARAATVANSSYDTQNKVAEVMSRRARELFVAVIGEASPLSISMENEGTIEASVLKKVSIPLKLTHRGEFTGPLALKVVGHPLLAAVKEINVDPKAEKASIELDLAQVKLPVGNYLIYAETLAKFKYKVSAAAKPADVSASFYSTPIRLRVTSAPPATKPVKK